MADIDDAIKRFKEFTGHDVDELYEMDVPPQLENGYLLGRLIGVSYEATRDNITNQYYHEFDENDRPYLCVSSDGQFLHILGGGYVVTDRGIEG